MAKEICISSTPHETRLAILEDDQLAEIYYERENEYTLAGSIYNGRVTRVLPGMQSAFVDLGLERDAFLYVTDFVELEDQEDTDELERATATAGNLPPLEVRHGGGQEAREPVREQGQRRDRNDGQVRDQGREQGRERGDDRRRDQIRPNEVRPNQASRPIEFAATQASDEHPVVPELEAANQETQGPAGGKRWRGRRHRRGRGPVSVQGQSESTASEPAEFEEKPVSGIEIAEDIQASEAPQRPPRGQQAPAPFVLPGESLSKYGGAPAEAGKPASESAPRPSFTTSKPSTMIESPLTWDGSGLLPGESLSKHRGRQPESEVKPSEAPSETQSVETIETDASEAVAMIAPSAGEFAEDEFAEEELVEEEHSARHEESAPPSLREIESAPHATSFETRHEEHAEALKPPVEEEPKAEFEEHTRSDESAPAAAEISAAAEHHGTAHHEVTIAGEAEPVAKSEAEPQADTEAEHRIDTASPLEFRLFGFGKKKKDDEDAAEAKPATAASVATVSAYAPGEGLVEEEVIEGEEYEAVPHHRRHKAEEHDLETFEEETLPPHLRTGDLGEMLQEAHLDHKIQLDLGEDEDDEEDEEEEGASAEAPPAPGQPQRSPRDRGRR